MTTAGAKGGHAQNNPTGNLPGNGAKVESKFQLEKGTSLFVVVGQSGMYCMGRSSTSCSSSPGGGGGGGTFVWASTGTLLLHADCSMVEFAFLFTC